MSGFTPSPMSRRGFLGLAAAAAAVPTLAACNVSGSSNTGGSGGSADPIKFWDQPWGATAYNDLGKKITEAYAPPAGMGKATYQIIPWNNFYQTYSSAIASGTGPAVSSGGGFQPFQFAEQGAIAYADKLLESWKAEGLYDDFLPGSWRRTRSTVGTRRCRGSWMRASCGPTRRCWRRPASKRPPTSTAGSASARR